MGLYDNQIKERRKSDQQLLEESFLRISRILGERDSSKLLESRLISKNSLDQILKYYHLSPVELPQDLENGADQLDYCLRPHGIMRREIKISGRWYASAFGPILAYMKDDGTAVALIPTSPKGYVFTDPKTGKRRRVDRKSSQMFGEKALCFYKPLPNKKLGVGNLISYMKGLITPWDVVAVVAATLLMTLIGIMVPSLVKQITGFVVESGSTVALSGLAISLLSIFLSSQLIIGVKNLLSKRIELKTSVGVQASMMMRLCRFRQASSDSIVRVNSELVQIRSTSYALFF